MDISNLAVDFAVVWNGNFIIDNPQDLKGKWLLSSHFDLFVTLERLGLEGSEHAGCRAMNNTLLCQRDSSEDPKATFGTIKGVLLNPVLLQPEHPLVAAAHRDFLRLPETLKCLLNLT